MSDSVDRHDGDEHQPRGAMFLGVVFLVMVVVLWLWTYSVLLSRG